MIVETKALETTPAVKPYIDLHDVPTSACTPISDWQGREENHLDASTHYLGLQGSEVLLDLAQVLLCNVIGAHMEKKQGTVVSAFNQLLQSSLCDIPDLDSWQAANCR